MPINEPNHLLNQDDIRELARSIERAAHGEHGHLINQFCSIRTCSKSTVYRRLADIGWSSGRKTRSDSGSTSQDFDVLKKVGALIAIGVRKNGKATMKTTTARSVLAANGNEFNVGNSQLNKLLKANNMGLSASQQATPHQKLRSLHPNHVHLVDPSVSLLFYSPTGKQKTIKDDEVYKNKPEAYEKTKKLRLWRYVMTDHYSHTIIVRYYQSPGENQEDLYDFLLYCWQEVEHRPFHGLPKILYWDKGSAMTSKGIKNACRSLSVTTIAHEQGRPRAKGSVEKANDMVECQFESLLKSEPVKSVEEINKAVENWYNAYNKNLILELDSKLARASKARYDLWQIIRKEHLRKLPDVEVCRYLLMHDAIERKVKSDLSIACYNPVSKKSEQYSVKNLPHIYVNAYVLVTPLIMKNLQVLIEFEDSYGEKQSIKVDPIALDELSGFALDAAIIGDEMKSKPDTPVEIANKQVNQIAYPGLNEKEIKKAKKKDVTPFNGTLKTHSHFADIVFPAYLPRQGSEISVPNHVENIPVQLSVVAICRQLVAQVGKIEGFGFHPWVKSNYPDGIAEEQFNKLVEHLKQDIPLENVTGLKLVAQSTHHK